MPKPLNDPKTLKMIDYALIAVSVLCALFIGSRVVEDLAKLPGIGGMLSQIGVNPAAGLTLMNIIFITIITIIAVYIGYYILQFVIKSAYEKDVLTNNEIFFIYLVGTLVAIAVGIFSGFAGDFRVMVTTIAYLIVVFVLTNLFLSWKKGGTNKVNIHLAVYAVVLIILALPMVRNLIFPAAV